MSDDKEKYGTLKQEAKLNVGRIDPRGVEIQEQTMRLFVRPGLDRLAAEGEADERCGTCAFRSGTVPGGCIQTQMDAFKAICEDVPFMCHAVNVSPERPFGAICHGWYAARLTMGGKQIPAPWPWSEDAEKGSL